MASTPSATAPRPPGRGLRRPSARARATGRRRGALAVAALAALLAVLAFLLYGRHLHEGYWVGDAWTTRAWYALYPHGDLLSTVGHFLDLNSMGARPANAIYRVALNGLLGADTGAWFGWQIASGVLMCVSVYALLRELGLDLADAAAVAALLLAFPASQALWLWSPVLQASLAISLGALGLILALRAFRAHGRRALLLHAASLCLFALSVLLYEVCLPAFLASVLLYLRRAPRRAALLRWGADWLVLVPLALLLTASTAARDQSLAGALAHGREMAGELPTLLFARLLPLGSVRWPAALALLALALGALWALRRPDLAPQARRRLRLLLGVGGAGIAVVFLAYLLYVPGLDYYHPLARGIGDRVNALAAIGWSLLLYAALALGAALLTLLLRLPSLLGRLAPLALAAALVISWLPDLAAESSAYITAGREGRRVLDVIGRAVPDPPRRGAAIWAFGQPVEVSAGVPLFANYWNMTAAVALTYHDPRLRAFVALPGTSFDCTATGVVPRSPPGGEYPPPPTRSLGPFGSRYGRTWFIDTVHGQFAPITSRAACLRAVASFALSPPLPPGA